MTRSAAFLLVAAALLGPACKKKTPAPDFDDKADAELLASIPGKEPAIDPQEKSVDAAFAKQGRSLDACHADAQQQTGAPVEGTVKVQLALKGGKPAKVAVLGNDSGNDYLAACVAEAIRGWVFPGEITLTTSRELYFGAEEGGDEEYEEGEE